MFKIHAQVYVNVKWVPSWFIKGRASDQAQASAPQVPGPTLTGPLQPGTYGRHTHKTFSLHGRGGKKWPLIFLAGTGWMQPATIWAQAVGPGLAGAASGKE